VDDHDLFRELLGVVLEHHAGFGESIHAGSLPEARYALNERRIDFDLAVVNLDLPDGNGFEVLEELRQVAFGLPVICVTANRDHGLRVRALEAGASEVIAATASREEIVATVRRLGR
jgi:two-component system response regulator TctD